MEKVRKQAAWGTYITMRKGSTRNARAWLTEVLSSLGDNIGTERHLNATSSSTANGDIEVDSRIRPASVCVTAKHGRRKQEWETTLSRDLTRKTRRTTQHYVESYVMSKKVAKVRFGSVSSSLLMLSTSLLDWLNSWVFQKCISIEPAITRNKDKTRLTHMVEDEKNFARFVYCDQRLRNGEHSRGLWKIP